MARVQHDFGRALEVLDEHRFHLPGKPRVLDDDVELAIADPARDVQVRRSDARPAAVGDRRLRMQHGPVPLEHADAALEQRPVPGTGDRPQRGNVGRPWHEQSHVHAVGRRRPQRLHVGRRACVIRVGEPQRFLRHRRDELIHAQQAGRVRACRRRHEARRLPREPSRRSCVRRQAAVPRRPPTSRRRRPPDPRRRVRVSRARCRATARHHGPDRPPTPCRCTTRSRSRRCRPRRSTCGDRERASQAAGRGAAGCRRGLRRRRRGGGRQKNGDVLPKPPSQS